MKYLSIIVPIVLLSGCMNGDMQGVMSDGTAISMSYEQGMSSDTYTTTIDGEAFKGKSVSVDQSVTFANTFGSAFATSGAYSASGFGSGFGIGSSMGGKFKAILLGSKGSSLKCLMQYADASGFTSEVLVNACILMAGQ